MLASIITTVCTTVGVPAGVFTPLKMLSKFFIVMAMAAIGMNTNIVKLVKTGGKADFHGLLPLGRHIACVSIDAALGSGFCAEKHKATNVLCAFRFCCCLSAAKAVWHRPVCAHGSALARLLVLLPLELQRLLRFAPMPTCAVCRPASRRPPGLRCAGLRQSQQPD